MVSLGDAGAQSRPFDDEVRRPSWLIDAYVRPLGNAERRVRACADKMRAVIRIGEPDVPRQRHHVGHREEFIENAFMNREMFRL